MITKTLIKEATAGSDTFTLCNDWFEVTIERCGPDFFVTTPSGIRCFESMYEATQIALRYLAEYARQEPE